MFRRKAGMQSESAQLPKILPDEELGRMANPHPRVPRAQRATSRHSRFNLPCFIILFVILAALSGVLFLFSYEKLPLDKHHVNFQCPSGPKEVAANFDSDRFKNAYLTEENAKDLEKFMKEFREKPYDDWQLPYNHMKSQMTHWKRKYFAPNIQDGDHIYESAIGIGMNALMTLEIIQEANGIQSLTIHGNEYMDESTAKANVFLERLVPEGVKKGTICAGDSSNLAHVPSDSMDLVYTGYISPIIDPLSFNQTNLDPYRRNHGRYDELCQGTDWKDQKLAEIAQQRNEDFFGKWVGEMARIAGPGRPVIIEHVSQPKCVHPKDWGGVPKSFWKEGIEKYNWPIDPDSIEMEDDHIYTMQRYHVFMRKTI